MAEIITLEELQQRCNAVSTSHYSYVVEQPDRSSVVVRIAYREHNFFGELKIKHTVIRFHFPAYAKRDGKIQVVMDVMMVTPLDKFWSPDLLAPLLKEIS